jgi:hypothetical protein
MRWFFVFVLALAVFSGLQGGLRKLGLGRLPGDFSFRLNGRLWHVSLGSSLLLSLIAMLIGELL